MRFNALTERYSYIIRGQFYGHSHTDHIGFFPSFKNSSEINNYFFIAPSLTTYSNKHPEYRIMTIDYDSLQVVDYDQYRYPCANADLISLNSPKKKTRPSSKSFIASKKLMDSMIWPSKEAWPHWDKSWEPITKLKSNTLIWEAVELRKAMQARTSGVITLVLLNMKLLAKTRPSLLRDSIKLQALGKICNTSEIVHR